MKKKADDEAALRKAILADPKLEAAVRLGLRGRRAHRRRSRRSSTSATRRSSGGRTGRDLFHIARALVRLPRELATPNDRRLKEYRDSNLDSLKVELFSSAPHLRSGGGRALQGVARPARARPRHRTICSSKTVLAGRTPAGGRRGDRSRGASSPTSTRRRALFDGGRAIDATADDARPPRRPARRGRARIRKRYEDEVEGPMRQAGAGDRAGGLRRARDERLPRRDLHAASLAGRGEGLHGGRQGHRVGDRLRGDVRARHGSRPLQAAEALARRQGRGRP